jgi:hypothetical protein
MLINGKAGETGVGARNGTRAEKENKRKTR